MGASCSSDQSAPVRRQTFRNTRPEHRGFAPRVQPNYPPQMNRQLPSQHAPVVRRPIPQRGPAMMPNQGRRVAVDQHFGAPLSQNMGQRSAPIIGETTSRMIVGRSPQLTEMISPQIITQHQIGPPQEVIRQPLMVPSSQIIGQPQVRSTIQTMPYQIAKPQPKIIYQPTTYNGGDYVVTQRAAPQKTCLSTVPQIVDQSQVVPMPNVIIRPEPPPCPTNVILPEVYSTPQQPHRRSIYRQPLTNTMNYRPQPLFN